MHISGLKSALEQANSYYESQNWQKALFAYETIVSENPYRAQYWYRLGEVHYHLKNYDESTKAFKMAVELGNAFGSAMYCIGRNFALQNNPTETVKWLEEAVKSDVDLLRRLETDSDLDNIRNDGRFIQLLPPKLSDDISRIDGWRTDLKFMAKHIEGAHYNLFRKLSREEWSTTIEDLYHRVPQLEDHEIVVEFKRIVASIGDGHTEVETPKEGKYQFHRIPVMFYEFADGLFIRAAASEYKETVGARVLKIGNLAAEQALDVIKTVIPRDNDMGIKEWGPVLLDIPEILHALKISNRIDQVEVLIENDRGEKSAVILKSELTSRLTWTRTPEPDWVTAREGANSPTPLWLRNPNDNYYFEYQEKSKVVYFQFNAVHNKPDESFPDFCKRLFHFINSNEVDGLIIDIRMNGGGRGALNRALLHELIKCEKVNQKGKLFTIIGRRTFSAAMNLAVDLERNTPTLFVGEPTGSSPNFVGETNPFTLPYSGLTVSVSNLYHQRSLPWDRRPWIAPDIVAELTSNDYKSNVDPAMNAILDDLGKDH